MAMIPSLLCSVMCVATLASTPAPSTKPLDAITTMIDAFQQHAIVALEEMHGNARGAAFRLALIRDPRFAASVNDVVVEFGNAFYQEVIDRFVAGETVPYEQLRRVWHETTAPQPIWDNPIYEEFFRAVRAVNQPLPRDRQLRVLLGDPPFDRNATTSDGVLKLRGQRVQHPADVVVREVLSKGRRALVVYGAMHLMRQNPQGASLIERIETAGRTKAFAVVTHPFVSLGVVGVDPSSWPERSLALTQGSSLAAQLDAILYLGPSARLGQAQSKPDFSGTWLPDPMPAPVTVPTTGPPPPPRTIGLTIAMSAGEIKVDRQQEMNGRETVATAVYKLDGTESVNQTGPLVYRTTASWDGASLVLTTTISTDTKPLGSQVETYRLENGQLTIEYTRQTPAGKFNGKTAHRKK
jgi:hypothetical protein